MLSSPFPFPHFRLRLSTLLFPLFLSLGVSIPAIAHNVEVSEDVAVTMHIAPNHNPKAGEPALTWFALTRKGGEPIPLEKCNCKLKIYQEPRKAGNGAVLEPSLTPTTVEQYQHIPGAKIIFPSSGQYTLELSGGPKAGEDFKPFKVQYEVTALAGKLASPTPRPTEASQNPQPQISETNSGDSASPWMIALAVVFGFGVASALLIPRKNK